MSTPTFAITHNLIVFLEKPSESDGFEQIVDFLNANQIKYALTVSPTIYTLCIKQFWTTLKNKTINYNVWLQALIYGKKVVITKASIRHDLKLNDAEGTSCLPNAEIFEELARMGAKTTSWNEFSSTMASAIICLANNQKFNFSKYTLDNLKKNLEAGVLFYMFPSLVEITARGSFCAASDSLGDSRGSPSFTKKVFANMKRVGTGFSGVVTPLFDRMMEKKERKETEVSPTKLPTEDPVPTPSIDPLLSGEDSKPLKELSVLCTNFSNKVKSLAYKETVMDKEKSSKQERKIADIDADAEVNLENVYNLDLAHKETVLSMHDATDADGKEVDEEMVEVITIAKIIVDEVRTAGGEFNATDEEPVSVAPINITTTQPSKATKKTVDITTAPKAKGIVFHEILIDKEVARRIEAEWNADMQDNIIWNEVVEQIQENAEKQKLEEQHEAKELKRNLEIVPDDKDDVFVNVAPLSSKPLTIMDYKIYKEGKKEHFQIIRANGNHQMYLAFSTMLKNFDIEDLKVLFRLSNIGLKNLNQKKS
uniref:Uncharacterized protein n=1 Tax=Tanacetum cinerariifolium TaxID=118510 RepID=A0A699HN45_TANCI|nr:hypothetical protein [Tanacetum cinerariifolium]